jgi:hypothetical protein
MWQQRWAVAQRKVITSRCVEGEGEGGGAYAIILAALVSFMYLIFWGSKNSCTVLGNANIGGSSSVMWL